MKTSAFFSVLCFGLVAMLAHSGCESLRRPTSSIPADYRGTPFGDAKHPAAPQTIPGRIECAFYDLGGEGVAYHDTDPTNNGNGKLNQQPRHQRPHASPEIWNFRVNEGVDLSYTKDFADFAHNQNMVAPEKNQFYIGWAEDGEWCNYTVNVKAAGRYRVTALYGNAVNDFVFVVDGKRTFPARFPVATGSMHKWNKAEVGTIEFERAGLHVLTLRYNKGNNFAYFEFASESR